MSVVLADVVSRTRDYYNAVAGRYFELFKDELTQKPHDRQLLAGFVETVGKGARICDAGCGPCGHVTRFLADQGANAFGIDLSERCIELARRAEPELSFQVMDMLQMDLPAVSLDGLVAYYSILYVPKPDIPGLLQEFRRVLKPRGHVLLVVKEGDDEGWIDDPMGSGEPTYFVHFREKELGNFLESNGFRVVSSEIRNPYPFEFQVRRISILAEKTEG